MMRIGNIILHALLKILLLFITVHSIDAQKTFTEIYSIKCRDTIIISGLGFPTWATAEIVSPPKYGYAKIEPNTGFQTMQYLAPPCFKGSDTIVVSCAKATQLTCDTGIYIMNIDCNEVANRTDVYNLSCRDSIRTFVSGFAIAQIIEDPFHGSAKMYRGATDLDWVIYKPDSLFAGLDYIKLNLFNGNESRILIYHVNCKSPVNTNGLKKIKANIYPNPVTEDVMHIPIPIESVQKLYLVNLMGKSISGNFIQTHEEILLDLKDLPNGWYTLVLIAGDEEQHERFLILR